MGPPEEPSQDQRLERFPFEQGRPEGGQDRNVQALRHTISKGEKKSINVIKWKRMKIKGDSYLSVSGLTS